MKCKKLKMFILIVIDCIVYSTIQAVNWGLSAVFHYLLFTIQLSNASQIPYVYNQLLDARTVNNDNQKLHKDISHFVNCCIPKSVAGHTRLDQRANIKNTEATLK